MMANRPLPSNQRLFGLKQFKLKLVHDLCDGHTSRAHRMPTCKVLIIKKEVFFTGKPASLYWQTRPDWVSTIAMGHDKLKSPQSDKKRHDRSEKREAKRKATDAA